VLSPDGSQILVANYHSDSVVLIDPVTMKETGRIEGTSAPHVVKYGPSRERAFVTCKKITGIAIIDPANVRTLLDDGLDARQFLPYKASYTPARFARATQCSWARSKASARLSATTAFRPLTHSSAASRARKKCIWLQVGLAGPIRRAPSSGRYADSQVPGGSHDSMRSGETSRRITSPLRAQADTTSAVSPSSPGMKSVSSAHQA